MKIDVPGFRLEGLAVIDEHPLKLQIIVNAVTGTATGTIWGHAETVRRLVQRNDLLINFAGALAVKATSPRVSKFQRRYGLVADLELATPNAEAN